MSALDSLDLIIPVYLNQRTVFDLFAMLRGGIATVTRITSTEQTKEHDQKRYGAAFGLSQALASLLKIDVSGERTKGSESGGGVERSEERVHTPPSLFQELRSILKSRKRLVIVDADYKPSPGDIVEFATLLQRNPVVEVMDMYIGLTEMAMGLGAQSQGGSKKQQQMGPEQLKKMMVKFAQSLKAGGTVDIVSGDLECGYKAVITLEEEYLNDPTMADLVEGQFRVVGKVIRVIPDTSASVNLLRKVPLGALNKPTLEQAFAALQTPDFKVPKIEWEIQGPVIHVVPIAIFA